MYPKVFKSTHNPDSYEWYAREIPAIDGVYVRIDKRCAFRLMRNKGFTITVSTSRGYFFTDFYDENWNEFCKFLSEFRQNNCRVHTGKNISYWFCLVNLSNEEGHEIAMDYPKIPKVRYANYSTIIKWYNKYSKKG